MMSTKQCTYSRRSMERNLRESVVWQAWKAIAPIGAGGQKAVCIKKRGKYFKIKSMMVKAE